jgi:hypothetical protein
MRSVLTVVALALAFVGQLSALVHWGVVQHSTCAEHGDIVDDDGGHCIVGLTPGEAIDAPQLDISDARISTPIDAPREAFAILIERDLLVVAPKTSPPV